MSDVETERDALLRRIREAREKSAAFVAETAERDELLELQRKARFEENRLRDLPHIRAAEDEYGVGGIRVVNTEEGAVVLRRPNHLAFNKFVRRMGSDKSPVDNEDYWRLVKPCIAYPDVTTVEAWTEKFAALTIRLGEKVVELGRGEAEEVEGK